MPPPSVDGLSALHLLLSSHSTSPGSITSCLFRPFLGSLDPSHSSESAKPIYTMIQAFFTSLSSILFQSPGGPPGGWGLLVQLCVGAFRAPELQPSNAPACQNSDTFWPQCSSSPPLLPLNIAWDHQILSIRDVCRLVRFVSFTQSVQPIHTMI
ncbi:hypothetical protein BS47DRAFT_1401581 [Hydnum rufescens UP504]|uniref:Uncharacterized protein n=1 Tax=Hydnum rufescens UP504 TaxID=1448309 RepID=A0A9P6AEB5_9AGAM|nr:hypothetical protein BS47DRAFT_1401581 [Hydnum rufescens UP504]